MTKAIVTAFCFTGLVLAAPNAASAQSAQCQAAMRSWQQNVASFNARCASAPAGSAQAASCNAQRQQIMASRPNCR